MKLYSLNAIKCVRWIKDKEGKNSGKEMVKKALDGVSNITDSECKDFAVELSTYVMRAMLYYKWKNNALKDTRQLFEAIGNQIAQNKWDSYVNPYCYHDEKVTKKRLEDEAQRFKALNGGKTVKGKKVSVGDNTEENGPKVTSENEFLFNVADKGIDFMYYFNSGFPAPIIMSGKIIIMSVMGMLAAYLM